MIEIRDLTVAYGKTVALRSLTLTIGPGITGVFGPNGSGKSTLLRVLTGLLRPTIGEVKAKGEPISSADESFRREVGYVGHSSGLYGHLTVEENLLLFARLHGVQASRISSMLQALGVSDRGGDRVAQLSAGLRRRVAVARALLHQPSLLLLDEPYANLDDEASELVSQALTAWRQDGRTALIATHGAKRVKSFADGSLILKQGRAISHRTRVSAEAPS